MLDIDGLIMRAERGVLRAPERFLEFFGESVCVHATDEFPFELKLTTFPRLGKREPAADKFNARPRIIAVER